MRKILTLILIGISILIFAGGVYAYGAGVTGYSQTGCKTCHGENPDPQTMVTITGIPDQYVPGDTYLLTINVTSTSVLGNSGGFDLSVTSGTLNTTDPNAQIVAGEATHKNNNARSWQVNWAAPTEIASINFYVAGLASDGIGLGGDEYSINSYTTEGPSTGKLPTAQFVYTRRGMIIEFEDQSWDVDGSIMSWLWDFGDNTNSTEKNPIHTFAKTDTYMVTLTVTDDQEGSNTQSQKFTVPSKRELLQLWTLQISIGSIIIVFTTIFAIGIATSKKRKSTQPTASMEERKVE